MPARRAPLSDEHGTQVPTYCSYPKLLETGPITPQFASGHASAGHCARLPGPAAAENDPGPGRSSREHAIGARDGITVRLETERLSLSRLLQRGRPSEGRPQNGSHSSELSSGISDHCSPTGGTRDGIARHER